MTYTRHYVWADGPEADSTWSVYKAEYLDLSALNPIEGTQQHVSTHGTASRAVEAAALLQQEWLDAEWRLPKYRYRWHVRYSADGQAAEPLTVCTTDGYTTFSDIPKILAVSKFSSNEPEHIAKIEIFEVRQIEKVRI